MPASIVTAVNCACTHQGTHPFLEKITKPDNENWIIEVIIIIIVRFYMGSMHTVLQ